MSGVALNSAVPWAKAMNLLETCADKLMVDDRMLPRMVRVVSRHAESNDTFTLTLEPPPDYRFLPGQFNMLYVFGVGEAAISVSGDPSRLDVLVHTIRAVGSVTHALAKLQPGDTVGVRGPFGSAWPTDLGGEDIVIVTGGIGLAPLRPVIYHHLRHRNDIGQLVLLHGIRTPADQLYANELDGWSQRDDFQVLLAANQADERWSGRVGLVTMLFGHAQFDPDRCRALLCGPEIMMHFCQQELAKLGVPSARTFVSLERNMQCAIGLCGHCQFGPEFLCVDGPVFRHDRVARLLAIPEV